MEAPDLKLYIEPNLIHGSTAYGTGPTIDKHAPWRLVVYGPARTQTPFRTLRDAKIAGGKRAEALGWTVAWERDPASARAYRARWVAPAGAA